MEAPRLRLAVAALLAGAAVAGCGGGTSSDSGVTDAQRASAQAAPPTRSPAIALQEQIVSVVKSVSPAVVQIQTNAGLGSGVVYDTKGDIVTNAHVVGEAKSFVITLASGETHKGTLVGTFPAGDLAVVRMGGARPKPAAFADSSKVRVGEFALAIGNLLGLRSGG